MRCKISLLATCWMLCFNISCRAELIVNFTQAADDGLNLVDLNYTLQSMSDESLKTIRTQADLNQFNADIISFNSENAKIACDKGLLLRLREKPNFRKFYNQNNYLLKNSDECTLPYAIYSTVIAYPVLNMVTSKPASVADFFDVDQFPGARGLPDSPIATLEWALLSYGVPYSEIYQLLSTERGLRLAFAKLDLIKRHIIWWQDISELKELIKNNQVSMVAGPSHIFFDLQFNQPMEILWDGQLLTEMKLGINANSSHVDSASNLLKTLMTDTSQFKFSYEFGFGPTNKETLKTLELLPQAGPILVFIPTYRENRKKAIWMNNHWHRILGTEINKKFALWRSETQQ